MPLPFLAVAAVGVGLTGIFKGGKAISNNSKANDLIESAEWTYNDAKDTLEYQKNSTVSMLDKLGETMLNSWSNDIGEFIPLFNSFKKVQVEKKGNINLKLKDKISSPRVMKNMQVASLKATEVLGTGVSALGAGALAGIASYGGAMMFASASTGTAIGKGAVRGGATGALSAVLRIGGKNHGIPVITDSAASTIIAGGIIDTGVSIYAYAQGEISGEQLREDLANTVVKSTVTIYMTKAATLALGGCGAFLPMAVYSVSSYMVACTREIIKNAKLNAEEYLRLTSLLEEETQIVYQQKTALEAQLSQYTDYRLRNMSEFLHRFDDVMQNGGNYDNAIFAIVSYANQTGIVLQHASKTDFDAAMISDNEFILK